MRKKIAIILLVFMVSGVSADIESVSIVNVFPDSSVLDRDVNVVSRLSEDGGGQGEGTATNVSLYINDTDGDIIRGESVEDIDINDNRPREIPLQVNSSVFDDYGKYTFIVNETTEGMSDKISYEIEEPVGTGGLSDLGIRDFIAMIFIIIIGAVIAFSY